MFNIRPATPNDIPEILKLIRELAECGRLTEHVVMAEKNLLRDGFSERRFSPS